jgi:hypothetical protein
MCANPLVFTYGMWEHSSYPAITCARTLPRCKIQEDKTCVDFAVMASFKNNVNNCEQ